MDKAFPPCALFNFNSTCRLISVLCIIAVLSMADRADRLFKVACLTVVYAAVMRAGIAALGALAVFICMGMPLYYCTVFVIEACCIKAVLLAALGNPIVVISDIYILAVFVKEHAAVGKKLAKSIIVLFFAHSCEDQAVAQVCRNDFYRQRRIIAHFVYRKRTEKGAVFNRKISGIQFKSIALNFAVRQCTFYLIRSVKRHAVKRQRASLYINGIAGGKEQLSAAFCVIGIEQNAVFNNDIRRAADNKHLLVGKAFKRKAAEIERELSMVEYETVSPVVVKFHIAEQL